MKNDHSVRVAMWSGPRNISTAMMRSWGNRSDTVVSDEPLYAHYLARTGLDHPGADEVIRHHEGDWRQVVSGLTGRIPEGKTIYYQKHMAHHLLPEIDRGWLARVSNAFLIRDPREMLTSLVHHLPRPRLADTGLPQQVEIFERVRESTGRVPPVVDARDVLTDPPALLRALCHALGVPFEERMIAWPAGPRDTDGIWARHWYGAVERSTGFKPYRPKSEALSDDLSELYDECLGFYRILHGQRIRAGRLDD